MGTGARQDSTRTMSGLIGMIVSLRQLKLQEQAQQLAREQMRISGINAQTGAAGGFQNMLSGLSDPMTMEPFISEQTERTGMSADALRTMMRGTPPATATTRSRKVAAGANAVSDDDTAFKEFLGMTPEGRSQGGLMAMLTKDAGDYYSTLTGDRKTGFQQGVLQRFATGQGVGEAASSQAEADFMENATPEVREQVVSIGKGLAPSASQDAQIRMGWAQYREEIRKFNFGATMEDLRTRSSVGRAQAELDASAFKEVNELLRQRSMILSDMTRSSATLTPSGVRSYVQGLNAFNEQLRRAAPQIYGKGGTHELQDINQDATITARNLGEFWKPK